MERGRAACVTAVTRVPIPLNLGWLRQSFQTLSTSRLPRAFAFFFFPLLPNFNDTRANKKKEKKHANIRDPRVPNDRAEFLGPVYAQIYTAALGTRYWNPQKVLLGEGKEGR